MHRSTLERDQLRRRPGGGGSSNFPAAGDTIKSSIFYADQVGVPTSSHPITPLAPTDLDNTYNDLAIAEFDDTVQQGRTFRDRVPNATDYIKDAGSVKFEVCMKAATAPGADADVQWGLYYRNINNGSALVAYVNILLGQQTITTDVHFHYASFTLDIGAAPDIDVTPGNHVEFELVRETPEGTNLTGDAHWYAVSLFWKAA